MRLDASYGEYFSVARGFVRLISEPQVMQACVGVGMRVGLADVAGCSSIMANLMRPDDLGAAELGYRALSAVAKHVPDRVVGAMLAQLESHDRVAIHAAS